ncbi:MAG: DUF368 domain-containing protein [Thermoplasmata archaeon]
MDETSFTKKVFQGIAMGLANVVPGISGGTMALIMDIYKRLIHSINTLPLTLPIKLLKGENVKEDWKQIDFRFLIPVALGVMISTLLLARVMEYFLDQYSTPAYSFFIGLILASLIVVYKHIEPLGITEICAGVMGFLFVFFMMGGNGIDGAHTPLSIFLAGIFSIASMILPGISGSMVLVLVGEYHFMLHALNSLELVTITIFIFGGLVGLFGLSKILEYLLRRSTSITMAFLFGLVFGGLRIPLEKAAEGDIYIPFIVIPAALGAVLLLIMEYYGSRVTYD